MQPRSTESSIIVETELPLDEYIFQPFRCSRTPIGTRIPPYLSIPFLSSPFLPFLFFNPRRSALTDRINQLINKRKRARIDVCARTRVCVCVYIYIYIHPLTRILPDRTGTIRARFRSTVKDNEPWNNNFFPPLSSPFPITLVS